MEFLTRGQGQDSCQKGEGVGIEIKRLALRTSTTLGELAQEFRRNAAGTPVIFVHPGERVEIGKTIGLVGMTGLAAGPHLDFLIEKKGQFLNFEKLGLSPAEPVSRKNWAQFAAVLENPEQLQSQVAQTGAAGR